MTGLLRVGVALIFSATVLGCGPMPGHPKPGAEVPRPDSILDFATLYAQNCAGCHGAGGMNGPSYPLANPEYQALVDEPSLHQVVANGERGTLMPAFAISAGGSLTDAQVDALVKGMRAAWYKGGYKGGASDAATPPYRAVKPVVAARGLEVYNTYCAGCHGSRPGKSKAGSITEPAFLALVSDQALRTIVIAGRPDIAQPDWRSDLPGRPMSDQEVTDVVGWLSSQRPGAQQTQAGGGSR